MFQCFSGLSLSLIRQPLLSGGCLCFNSIYVFVDTFHLIGVHICLKMNLFIQDITVFRGHFSLQKSLYFTS